jgi:hypothetical protein
MRRVALAGGTIALALSIGGVAAISARDGGDQRQTVEVKPESRKTDSARGSSVQTVALLNIPGIALACTDVQAVATQKGFWVEEASNGEFEAEVVVRDVSSSDFPELADPEIQVWPSEFEGEATRVEGDALSIAVRVWRSVETEELEEFDRNVVQRAAEEILAVSKLPLPRSPSERINPQLLSVAWPNGWKQTSAGEGVFSLAEMQTNVMWNEVGFPSTESSAVIQSLQTRGIERITWSTELSGITLGPSDKMGFATLGNYQVSVVSSQLSEQQTQAFADSLTLSDQQCPVAVPEPEPKTRLSVGNELLYVAKSFASLPADKTAHRIDEYGPIVGEYPSFTQQSEGVQLVVNDSVVSVESAGPVPLGPPVDGLRLALVRPKLAPIELTFRDSKGQSLGTYWVVPHEDPGAGLKSREPLIDRAEGTVRFRVHAGTVKQVKFEPLGRLRKEAPVAIEQHCVLLHITSESEVDESFECFDPAEPWTKVSVFGGFHDYTTITADVVIVPSTARRVSVTSIETGEISETAVTSVRNSTFGLALMTNGGPTETTRYDALDENGVVVATATSNQ